MIRIPRAATLAWLVTSGSAWAGGIQSDVATVLDPVEVSGAALAGSADSATQGTVMAAQLENRPLLRSGELLEVVPGLIVTQHSGGGKANQYFLRGFNLDHGTDFSTTVAGMPVNLPTHAHGQGYSDLSFVIPELVSLIRYRKGPYYAEVGDFASAGSAEMQYVDRVDATLVDASLGQDGYQRLLAADSARAGSGTVLYALEYSHQDGPWDVPEDLRRLNGVLRYSLDTDSGHYGVTLMGYDGRWTSTDQIPQRAVADGSLGRYGSLDPSDGGESHRYSLSLDWQRGDDIAATQANAYFIRYALSLFSNFTYFLDDATNGDQFEQADQRSIAGFNLSHEWHGHLAGRHLHQRVGVQLRHDDIGAVGLFHTRERQRLSNTREDEVMQTSGGAFYSADIEWLPWLRSVAGLRADAYRFEVNSSIAANSGTATDHRYSPKLSLIFGPWAKTEFFANAGRGFHSNDARGTTITLDPSDPSLATPAQRVDPLVRTVGYEIGAKTLLVPGLQSSLSLWRLELDSELLFVGDAGNTEPSRPSRREGIEWANYYSPHSGLIFDADAALSRARFTDGDPSGNRIPGSIERTASIGVSLSDLGNFFGGLRLRYFGPRPLIEDNSVRSSSSTLVNLRVGYHLSPSFQLALDAFNLFDREVSDIEYFYESQLAGESAPVEDVHFHPVEPRSLRLSVQGRF